jgi:hypothetical protein
MLVSSGSEDLVLKGANRVVLVGKMGFACPPCPSRAGQGAVHASPPFSP